MPSVLTKWKQKILSILHDKAKMRELILYVVFGALTLTRTVRKAALTKDISAMEQAIQRIQNSNAELILQVTEARDMARIGYAAVMNLDMVSADKAETIHVRALNTRPFGDTESSAFAGAKTGSRQSFQ